MIALLLLLLAPWQEDPVEALHKLVHAGRVEEVIAKTETLALDDPAWKKLADVLLEAAARTGDYAYFLRKAPQVIDACHDASVRSRVRFALGNAWWRSGQLDAAKAAFERVAEESPDPQLARSARGNVCEILDLAPGRPAPAFTARAIGGEEISNAVLRGKVVLLHFWASW